MSLQVTIPALRKIDKTAIILAATVLFFVFNILDIEDLELIPWNIVLLFSGAMSIGFCLWQTGAAEWMAVNWLAMFKNAHWLVFVVERGVFRHDPDQLHNERGRNSYRNACRPGNIEVPLEWIPWW